MGQDRLDGEMLTDFLSGKLSDAEAEICEQYLSHASSPELAVDDDSAGDTLVDALRQAEHITADDKAVVDALISRISARLPAESLTEINDGEQELIDQLDAPESDDELGRLGNYRVLSVIGTGGMGVVFRAEDPDLQRPVALKAMKPILAANQSAARRFQREAMAAAGIEHDRIITIYRVGRDRGIPFLTMQLLEGESLQARLERDGQLTIEKSIEIARQVSEGLAAAHRQGLLHRDIKPDNIWLQLTEDSVKILDFGLVRSVDEETGLTNTGAILGTPKYMSPEQAKGAAIDHRSDLFSLGSVLYRMVTGQVPFARADFGCQRNPPSASGASPPIRPRLIHDFQFDASQLAWSPNSRLLALYESGINILDVRSPSGTMLPNQGMTGSFSERPWSVDGRYFASHVPGEGITVWSMADQTPYHTIPGEAHWNAKWSPDGKHLAFLTATNIDLRDPNPSRPAKVVADINLVVWNTMQLRRVKSIPLAQGHEVRERTSREQAIGAEVVSAANKIGLSWSPDGQMLASLFDGITKAWTITEENPDAPITSIPGRARSFRSPRWFNHGNRFLQVVDGIVRHGDATTGETEWFRGPKTTWFVPATSFRPDKFATLGYAAQSSGRGISSSLGVWEKKTAAYSWQTSVPGDSYWIHPYYSYAIGRDGQMLATITTAKKYAVKTVTDGREREDIDGPRKAIVAVTSLASGNTRRFPYDKAGKNPVIMLSPDARFVAVRDYMGGRDNAVDILDVENGTWRSYTPLSDNLISGSYPNTVNGIGLTKWFSGGSRLGVYRNPAEYQIRDLLSDGELTVTVAEIPGQSRLDDAREQLSKRDSQSPDDQRKIQSARILLQRKYGLPIEISQSLMAVAASNNGKLLAACVSTFELSDANTSARTRPNRRPSRKLEKSEIQLWDVSQTPAKKLKAIPCDSVHWVQLLAFTKDDSRILIGGPEGANINRSTLGSGNVWSIVELDVERGEVSRQLCKFVLRQGMFDRVWAVRDNRILANIDYQLREYDLNGHWTSTLLAFPQPPSRDTDANRWPSFATISSRGGIQSHGGNQDRFVFVALRDDGQVITVSPSEFSHQFGWRNASSN